MNKKIVVGGILLIVLITVGCVFLILNEQAELKQIQNEADKLWNESQNPQQNDPKLTDANRPPPPGETHEIGHWKDDQWHRTVSNADQRHIGNALPRTTENPKRRKWLREGEAKEGHFHSVDEEGYLICDENGNLIETPYGDPAFHIITTIGFRPSYEEYQEYKKLVAQGNAAHGAGNMAEYNRLIAEVLQFRRDHQGVVPDVTTSTVFPDDHTPATPAAVDRFDRISMASGRRAQLYREWGLGYLLED